MKDKVDEYNYSISKFFSSTDTRRGEKRQATEMWTCAQCL